MRTRELYCEIDSVPIRTGGVLLEVPEIVLAIQTARGRGIPALAVHFHRNTLQLDVSIS